MSDVSSVSATSSDGKCSRPRPRPYSVDLFVELKKYWVVGGVLVSVALSVVAPNVGAPGGLLQTQYSRYLPLCYVWYVAGKGAGTKRARPSRRLLALAAAHAALVVPTLALTALRRPPLHHPAELEGLSTWLSVALCEDEAAAAVTVVAYLAALFVTPLATFTLEGRAAIPSLGAALGTGMPAAGAYCAGAWRGGGGADCGAGRALAALALLYAQCCAGLAVTGRGPAAPGALAASAAREAGWWVASAALCWAYRGCGATGGRGARLLAGCAVPRGLDAAAAWGALPPPALDPLAVLRQPAVALLLAALAAHRCDRPAPTPDTDPSR